MSDTNPLLQDWQTPHGLPPFAQLQPEHFEPALFAAMQQHRDELAAIATQTAPPSFDNTLATFDRAGRRLARVAATFSSGSVSRSAARASRRGCIPTILGFDVRRQTNGSL